MAFPKPSSLLATVLAWTLTFTQSARAIDFNWTGAVDSNWLTPDNWTPTGPPSGGGGNFARFTTPGAFQPVINADLPVVQDYLTGNGGIVITHTAGLASQTGWFRMGALGTAPGDVGTYNLSGGTMEASSYRITEQTGQVATINITGGLMRQTDVTPNDGGAWTRFAENGTANLNLSNTGMISLDSRVLLGVGTGIMNGVQTGGIFEIRRGEFVLGDGFSANSVTPNATYRISGGTLRAIRFHQDGNEGGNITVGEWDRANSLLEISGTATVEAATNVVVGQGRPEFPAKGTVTQTGGTLTFGGNGQLNTGPNGELQDRSIGGLQMATDATSIADYTISSGTIRQNDFNNVEDTGSWSNIGQNGRATFNISGDAMVSFSSRTLIAASPTSVATVTQTGGTFEVRNHEVVIADLGQGTYNISGGTLQTFGGRPISVGNWNGGRGNLNVSGTAQVITGGNLLIGQAESNNFTSSGTVTQTGGTVTVGNDITMGSNSVQASGTYNLNGGVLDLTGGNILRLAGTSTFNMTAGILRNVGSIVGNSLDNTFTHQGGTLEVGAIQGPGGFTTINGNYSLLAAGTIKIELMPGTIDQLNVFGTVAVAGILDLEQLEEFTIDTPLTLLFNDDVDPVVGAFANALPGVPFGHDGRVYTVFYNGGDGNDIIIIPEPTGLGVLTVAFLSYGVLARRRRRN